MLWVPDLIRLDHELLFTFKARHCGAEASGVNGETTACGVEGCSFLVVGSVCKSCLCDEMSAVTAEALVSCMIEGVATGCSPYI